MKSTHLGESFSTKELWEVSERVRGSFEASRVITSSRLVLMALDPYHLHVYWHMTQAVLTAQKASDLNGHFLMRFYRLPGEVCKLEDREVSFDITVQGLRNQRNVQLPNDDCYYMAELGVKEMTGDFQAWLSSNVVHVPRAANTPRLTEYEEGMNASSEAGVWDEALIDGMIQDKLGLDTASLLNPSSSYSSYNVSSRVSEASSLREEEH